jgi:hypothetical protein
MKGVWILEKKRYQFHPTVTPIATEVKESSYGK